MSIRNAIATTYHAIQLARKYPSSQRLKVMCDYTALYRAKGLTPEEYYEFEFEKQSEDFRRDFLGLNEQRYYLDLLNPLKYFSLARNKYMAHKMLENKGVRTSELYCYYQPEATYAENMECAGDHSAVLRILKTKGQSGGHRFLHVLADFRDAGVHLGGVGTRRLENHQHSTGGSIDIRHKAVALSTNLHRSHVAQVQHVAALSGAQHDVVKLLDGLQRTLVLH